jgi:hypothetical protein
VSTRAAIAVEEAEAEFAGVLVDAAFTDAGNPARAHQGLYPRGRKVQQLSDKCGVNDERIVAELDPLLRGGGVAALDHRISPCRGIQKDI